MHEMKMIANFGNGTCLILRTYMFCIVPDIFTLNLFVDFVWRIFDGDDNERDTRLSYMGKEQHLGFLPFLAVNSRI